MRNGMYCRSCLRPLEKRGSSYTCTNERCDFCEVLIHRDEIRIDPEEHDIAYAYQEPEACGDDQFLDMLRECQRPDEGEELNFG